MEGAPWCADGTHSARGTRHALSHPQPLRFLVRRKSKNGHPCKDATFVVVSVLYSLRKWLPIAGSRHIYMGLDMNDSHALRYIVHAHVCYLFNTSGTDIAEIEYESSFVGLEGGSAVCVEYGRWKLRDFPTRSCVVVHRMTQEDQVYLPMRSGWFQLDVHRMVTANGEALAEPLMLKAAEKWGGFTFSETVLEREPEQAEPLL
jgi:hypothetical protein